VYGGWYRGADELQRAGGGGQGEGHGEGEGEAETLAQPVLGVLDSLMIPFVGCEFGASQRSGAVTKWREGGEVAPQGLASLGAHLRGVLIGVTLHVAFACT